MVTEDGILDHPIPWYLSSAYAEERSEEFARVTQDWDWGAIMTAARIPRTISDLGQAGYVDMVASSDLHEYGWTIRQWYHPAEKWECVVYRAREGGEVVVAHTYREQCAFHRRIGANVVPPGEKYTPAATGCEQPWLY